MLIIASCFSDKSRTTKKTLCCGSNQCKVYNHWHCSFEKCNWTALHSTNLEFPYFPVTKVSKFFLKGVLTPQTIAYSSNYPYRVVIWAHNSVSIKVNKWTCGFLFILDFDSNSQEVAGHVTSSASHSFGKFVLHVKKQSHAHKHGPQVSSLWCQKVDRKFTLHSTNSSVCTKQSTSYLKNAISLDITWRKCTRASEKSRAEKLIIVYGEIIMSSFFQ